MHVSFLADPEQHMMMVTPAWMVACLGSPGSGNLCVRSKSLKLSDPKVLDVRVHSTQKVKKCLEARTWPPRLKLQSKTAAKFLHRSRPCWHPFIWLTQITQMNQKYVLEYLADE